MMPSDAAMFVTSLHPCAVAKEQVSTATSAAEVAEARLKSTQEQLGKANDTAVAAQDQLQQLQLSLEVGVVG
jgi:uncharacterized phage infection (PIP) family protein YhgE